MAQHIAKHSLKQLYAIDSRAQSDVLYSTGEGQVTAYDQASLSSRFVTLKHRGGR